MGKLIQVFGVVLFLMLSSFILVDAEMVDQMSYYNHDMDPGKTYYSPEYSQGSNTTVRGWFDNNGSVGGDGDMAVYHKVTGDDIYVCGATAGYMAAGTGHKECSVSGSGIEGDVNYTAAWYNNTDNNGYITSQVGIE